MLSVLWLCTCMLLYKRKSAHQKIIQYHDNLESFGMTSLPATVPSERTDYKIEEKNVYYWQRFTGRICGFHPFMKANLALKTPVIRCLTYRIMNAGHHLTQNQMRRAPKLHFLNCPAGSHCPDFQICDSCCYAEDFVFLAS